MKFVYAESERVKSAFASPTEPDRPVFNSRDKVEFSVGPVEAGRGWSASIKLGSMLGRGAGCHGLPLTASLRSDHAPTIRTVLHLRLQFHNVDSTSDSVSSSSLFAGVHARLKRPVLGFPFRGLAVLLVTA